MIPLVHLLKQVGQEIYHSDTISELSDRSIKSFELDKELLEWKKNLPVNWNLDKSSLTEPEWMSKQKIVLKLRRHWPDSKIEPNF